MKLAMIAGAAAGLGMLVGALPAAAQQEVNEGPWPSKVIAGNPLSVEGHCGDMSSPLVTSPGFAGSVKIGTGGKAVDKPGKYTATLKCKDKVLNTTFEVVKSAQLSVQPKQVRPGGELRLVVWCPPLDGQPAAHSPGFAATIQLGFHATSGQGFGDGKATTKPGTYTATVDCGGVNASATFAVVKPGTPQPSQVTIKPKGAPQTGGGFLAG
jgi:hypothetical protein